MDRFFVIIGDESTESMLLNIFRPDTIARPYIDLVFLACYIFKQLLYVGSDRTVNSKYCVVCVEENIQWGY